jgi:hypothetical protein
MDLVQKQGADSNSDSKAQDQQHCSALPFAMTLPIPSTLAGSTAWRHVHIGQLAKYTDQEVEDVVTAVKGRQFEAADFSWLKILVPGEAYAVHVAG